MKKVVVMVTRKNTGLTHIDRYNPDSTVTDQVKNELDSLGDIVDSVIINTAGSQIVVKYDEE